MPEHDPREQKREHRPRVLKGATIILDIHKSEIACVVRNQHANGAELKLDAGLVIPEHFTLYVPTDGFAYESVVRWRRGDRVGVQFGGKGPKPRHHY